ncbi:MAG: ABC transporter substrate-binding protein [Gammaproteobacteria bacterium]
MNASVASIPVQKTAIQKLWFTRCPVPTPSAIAYKLGWLAEEFARDGIQLATFQEDAKNGELARHHYDHELPGLFREGGNMLPIASRAQGSPNRLIGLTWIDEGQAIVVRKGSGITEPRQLKGARIALPGFVEKQIPSHVRGTSIGRGMTLAGVKGALTFAGLSFDDVKFVEIPVLPFNSNAAPREGLFRLWWGLQHLAEGKVDAVYVKGAAATQHVRELDLQIGIDLDRLPDRRFRVNNGTPRPITVHQDLLDDHYDLVVRFLEQTLRAADWAATNVEGVRQILQSETRGDADAVLATYRDDFHKRLHPTLDPERLELFRRQKDFLLVHGFLDRDYDFDAWVEPRPLAEAAARRAAAK